MKKTHALNHMRDRWIPIVGVEAWKCIEKLLELEPEVGFAACVALERKHPAQAQEERKVSWTI